jgi:hypothetical protein
VKTLTKRGDDGMEAEDDILKLTRVVSMYNMFSKTVEPIAVQRF